MKRLCISASLIFVLSALVYAAETPQLINYQGVLRDANNKPLSGMFDMVFRFYETDGAPDCLSGTLLLSDSHVVSGTGAVAVSSGLFNAQLGGGELTPGTVATLAGIFRDHDEVYLEVQVLTETLCPRTRVLASAYAINAARESDGSLQLYVDTDHPDASDDNNGLSPSTPKKTIQAAIDAVPAVLGGPATISIVDGTYNESLLIDRRFMRGVESPIILQGNVGAPAMVTLDGQGSMQRGIGVIGFAEIYGMEVTGFIDEGISVGYGNLIIDNCRIKADADENGLGIFRSEVELTNTLITNSAGPGIEVHQGNMSMGDVAIAANTGIILIDSSSFFLTGDVFIQGVGSAAVDLDGGCSADFGSRTGLTVENTTGGDAMLANYHSTIRGYGLGTGTIGGCDAQNGSFCHP